MAVYERATQAVETDERHHMFNIYIKRAAEIYGVTYTRAIYQKAIEVEHILIDIKQFILFLFFIKVAGLQRKLYVQWHKNDLIV